MKEGAGQAAGGPEKRLARNLLKEKKFGGLC